MLLGSSDNCLNCTFWHNLKRGNYLNQLFYTTEVTVFDTRVQYFQLLVFATAPPAFGPFNRTRKIKVTLEIDTADFMSFSVRYLIL